MYGNSGKCENHGINEGNGRIVKRMHLISSHDSFLTRHEQFWFLILRINKDKKDKERCSDSSNVHILYREKRSDIGSQLSKNWIDDGVVWHHQSAKYNELWQTSPGKWSPFEPLFMSL